MAQKTEKPKKVGLALGGGGAKGFAHIGVIKTLVDAGISIEYIAGTSMGALVGGYYAATKNIRRLEALATNFDGKKYFPSRDVVRDHEGVFFRDASIEHVLEEEFHNIRIEDLQIPFVAIATDAKNGEEVRISKGKLVHAVRASTALPIIFSPVELDGRLLIDGGLANPVPANVVREMGAEYVIAVDVSSKWLDQPEKMMEVRDMYSIITNSFSVIEYQIGKTALKSADIVLRPSVMKYEWMSFPQAREILERGEWITDYYLRDIRKGSGYIKTFATPIEEFIDFFFGK
ncbi:MAG: hypothetical protein A2847_01600 [Candidatus Sungbacteria bacterium RIFCSPHIGHO2_01_FULL_50_25]|uniref:PNPLA domain-containing protein n=1 Tax=Candidatus Sungbacteria bacterium RIFCSPHIGHO2_01_FULL_50_25 TaxID=1802265 RepID=A0A1G2KE15_9BACT|nr:MAG: hypothetical protein A2847_01600 [Candidatus Sungbacteria bacterium RIFCSPHIGHO2_01_FULL_50_25]